MSGVEGGAEADPMTEELLSRLKAEIPGPPRWLLAVTGVLSMVQFVIVVPWLVGADPWGLLGPAGEGHLTRDGALGLVVAIPGLLAVWRPRWALPCFLLSSMAVIAQAVAGVLDRTDPGGSSGFGAEFIHVPSIVLTCLIGLVAAPAGSLMTRRGGRG